MANPTPSQRYPLPQDPIQAVRLLMNGLLDTQDAIAALKSQQDTVNTSVTQIVSQVQAISGATASSIAKMASHWLDSYDANTGGFTSSQPSASDLTNGTTGTGAVVLADSPALTTSPTAPTQSLSDNSTKLATTAFVKGQGYVSATFVDDEVVAGSGFAWTLAGTPSPVASLQLFADTAGFGAVLLIRGSAAAEGYSIVGAAITTVTSYGAGVLSAWYRK